MLNTNNMDNSDVNIIINIAVVINCLKASFATTLA